MLEWLRRIRQWFSPRPAAEGLTVIEYEAVSLIAYEGEQPTPGPVSRRSTVSHAAASQAGGSCPRLPLRLVAGHIP